MSYYPKSQVKTNKYTNGDEFQRTDTNEAYRGYYWQTSINQYFTGKTPQDLPTIQLIPIQQEVESTTTTPQWVESYPNSIIDSNPGRIPNVYIAKPTENDYKLGEFERYFTKKSNQNIYFEISKEDYTKLNSKSPKILYQLYIPIKLSWQLVGDSQKINQNTVLITERQQKLPGFTKFFKGNFAKYNK